MRQADLVQMVKVSALLLQRSLQALNNNRASIAGGITQSDRHAQDHWREELQVPK
jgi:hypothetical protein